MNQQFISVTEARANFKALLNKVASGQTEVVLLRDSNPEAVLVPYKYYIEKSQSEKSAWNARFDAYIKKARKIGKTWAKKQNIKLKSISEDELYERIKQV